MTYTQSDLGVRYSSPLAFLFVAPAPPTRRLICANFSSLDTLQLFCLPLKLVASPIQLNKYQEQPKLAAAPLATALRR